MITSDGQLEVEEQESGTYVFPNSKKYASTWALFVYKDGRAELYKKRDLETGAILGKPVDLGLSVHKIHPYDMAELIPNVLHFNHVLKKTDRNQEVHEINGKLYFQTTSIPAVTKNIQ
jgi:hypothetical protein